MSRKSSDWAWQQDLKPSLKLVLLSLADRTNEYHECFPSRKRLVRDTNLNIKTVQKCLKTLCLLGFLADTGEKKGRTKKVKVYRFTFKNANNCNRPNFGSIGLNRPKTGAVKQTLNRVSEPPILFNHPIKEKINKKKVFKKPKKNEIEDYAFENNLSVNINADQFIDYYESKGWLVGKVKMKCWKSAFRNWCRNAKKFEKKYDNKKTIAERNNESIERNLKLIEILERNGR